jgi:transcriptional regulator with XRE-family HTH domain
MMNRIKDVIKEKGYTIKGLAEEMGMTRENLSRIIQNPSTPTLERLSAVLNVPVWQFFASREDVAEEMGKDGQVITCPRCGEKIKVRTDVVAEP